VSVMSVVTSVQWRRQKFISGELSPFPFQLPSLPFFPLEVGPFPSFPFLPSPPSLDRSRALSSRPFSYPPLEVGPLKCSYGVWGNAVSSPSGVWGTAPEEETDFGAL